MAPKIVASIIGSDKGGVGKSMISQIFALVYDHGKIPLRVIEIDNQKKLSSSLGEKRINLSMTAAPDLQEVSRRRHLAESFYNPVYLEWQKGDSITDLGANVTTSLMSWVKHCQILELAAEDSLGFQFIACASPDEQAIKSALNALKEAKETFGSLGRYCLLLNDLGGSCGFVPYATNEAYQTLLSMRDKKEIIIIDVPYCDSILLEQSRAMNMNLVDAVNRADEVAAAANLDPVSSRVHKRKMITWMRETQSALQPLFHVSQAAAVA